MLGWKKHHHQPTITCPHPTCQQVFVEPLQEKGVLFCPHCHNSLLKTSVAKQTQKSITSLRASIDNYPINWQLLTATKT